LSVSVTDQPLVRLFEEISTQTGVNLMVHGTEHGLISADFHDLPLEMGIRRLLDGRSHVIFHDSEGKGKIMVWILSSPGVVANTPLGGSRSAASRRRARPVQRSAEASRGAERAAERRRQIRNLHTGDSAENTIPVLPDEFGGENEIIRNAILQGQIPEELIKALTEGLNQ
jgi:hypothetical protein